MGEMRFGTVVATKNTERINQALVVLRRAMEYAVRLDGARLVSVLEATVRNLELLPILPEKDPTNERDFQPAVRDALHRQVLFALSTSKRLVI